MWVKRQTQARWQVGYRANRQSLSSPILSFTTEEKQPPHLQAPRHSLPDIKASQKYEQRSDPSVFTCLQEGVVMPTAGSILGQCLVSEERYL